eukprot:CAMPEP_0174258496 /NCGR_PEP_ID=MMETSP0439-20130205/7478_1 /TAXON_ID=0 /ORGANISM="Stereomyxa ramosa, Strain Chinc5" /LENGTH=485 /DNA_ID=CAMNT_0015342025 /DNA_START=174 /DNA_END=1631 /DNA_ORIENTATION=+
MHDGDDDSDISDDEGFIDTMPTKVINYTDIIFDPEADYTFGGFAAVCKATYLGQDVAVKRLYCDTWMEDPEEQKYIMREMSVLESFEHPNILDFIGYCIDEDNTLFIVTEWLACGDLWKKVSNTNEVIEYKDIARWATDTASALAYLHSLDVIHRDLKCENLLLTADSHIKICDLGFARSKKTRTNRRNLKMTIVGTEPFMAPEVITGRPYNEKCDVFSFGVVLLEMMARKHPPLRKPDNGFGFCAEEINDMVPLDCPEALAEFTYDCIEYFAEERPSFDEILISLKSIHTELEEADRKALEELATMSQKEISIRTSNQEAKKEEICRRRAEMIKAREAIRKAQLQAVNSLDLSILSVNNMRLSKKKQKHLYCNIYINNILVHQTSRIKDCDAPIVLPIVNPEKDLLKVQVVIKKKVRKDEPYASITFPISQLEFESDSKYWFTLQDRKGNETCGEILMITKVYDNKSGRPPSQSLSKLRKLRKN